MSLFNPLDHGRAASVGGKAKSKFEKYKSSRSIFYYDSYSSRLVLWARPER